MWWWDLKCNTWKWTLWWFDPGTAAIAPICRGSVALKNIWPFLKPQKRVFTARGFHLLHFPVKDWREGRGWLQRGSPAYSTNKLTQGRNKIAPENICTASTHQLQAHRGVWSLKTKRANSGRVRNAFKHTTNWGYQNKWDSLSMPTKLLCRWEKVGGGSHTNKSSGKSWRCVLPCCRCVRDWPTRQCGWERCNEGKEEWSKERGQKCVWFWF